MREVSILRLMADIVVRRVLSDPENRTDLGRALEREYPFSDHPQGRQIWLDALLRHAYHHQSSQRQIM